MSLYFMPGHHSCCNHHHRERNFLDTFLNDIDRIELALIPLQESSQELTPQQKQTPQQGKSGGGQMAKVVDDKSKLAISLNVGKFKPEELSVDLDGRILKVQGKQEIKDKDGYSMRTFVRQWLLPKDIDVDQLKSSITEDGNLAIEAPKITKNTRKARSIQIDKAPAAVKGSQQGGGHQGGGQQGAGHQGGGHQGGGQQGGGQQGGGQQEAGHQGGGHHGAGQQVAGPQHGAGQQGAAQQGGGNQQGNQSQQGKESEQAK